MYYTDILALYKLYESYKYGYIIYNFLSERFNRKKKIEQINKASKKEDGWEIV